MLTNIYEHVYENKNDLQFEMKGVIHHPSTFLLM
jgi:hypothetical protein